MGFEIRPIKQMEPGRVGAVRASVCGKVVTGCSEDRTSGLHGWEMQSLEKTVAS